MIIMIVKSNKIVSLCSADDLEKRPKLNLKPRSVPTSKVDELADGTSRMAIFGGGRPRDEKEYQGKERKSSHSSDEATRTT